MLGKTVIYVVLGQLFALMISESGAQDSDGVWYTRNANLHRYFFTHDSFTWQDAVDRCSDMNGYLLTISSREESEFLESIQGENVNHWIGLSGTCGTGGCHSFNWVVNEGGSYQNWRSFGPTARTRHTRRLARHQDSLKERNDFPELRAQHCCATKKTVNPQPLPPCPSLPHRDMSGAQTRLRRTAFAPARRHRSRLPPECE